ncbi:hypothetical protein PROFUN_12138 [Planoprotostelium fungivorum]|uniref:Uncharacterized protein n=1 Tax=Planoprotostelium fungivorum TaxID=1890364 RepID=A0A2P6N8A8_9EUKA|nr:hypothetical protein PROFUN_12138 [Planoprotostelium fungivorum]
MSHEERRNLLSNRLLKRMAQKNQSVYRGPWAPSQLDVKDGRMDDERDSTVQVVDLVSDSEDELDEDRTQGRTRAGETRFSTLKRILDNMDEVEDSVISSEDKERLSKLKFSKAGQFCTVDLDYDPMDDPVFKHVFAEKARQKKARGGSLSSGATEDSRPLQTVPTARLKNAYASMNQYLRQAALLWKTVRPDEEFSWETLFNRSFIKIWIWFWDKRASVGETSFATPQNRVKGIAEVIKRSMAYLPEDANQEYYSTQMVVSRDLLNGARSVARGTEAANCAANSHREILEQNKQVTYYQSHEGHLDLPAARRLQDALIILLSLSAGGQRPQFVHLLEYDTIDGNPKIGFFLRMPDEKIVRVAGSRVPLPPSIARFWGYFVKHARPVLMSEDQREAWYRSQDPHLSAEKRKVAIRQIDRHLFYDTKGRGAEPKSVDCCIKNFVSTYVPEAKYGTGMSICRCFASYVFLGWQTETGERVEVGDYCKLINTSEKMFMDHYNREAGTEKLRETQDKLSKSLHPTSHDKSVSDILGFICDIDDVVDQEDEREESDQEQKEETYDLCDLEEYLTQYEWIQANPSQNRSYNYKVNLSSLSTEKVKFFPTPLKPLPLPSLGPSRAQDEVGGGSLRLACLSENFAHQIMSYRLQSPTQVLWTRLATPDSDSALFLTPVRCFWALQIASKRLEIDAWVILFAWMLSFGPPESQDHITSQDLMSIINKTSPDQLEITFNTKCMSGSNRGSHDRILGPI